VPSGNVKFTRPEDASVVVIERSKTNRGTDRQRNVEIKRYVVSERKGSGRRKKKKEKTNQHVEWKY